MTLAESASSFATPELSAVSPAEELASLVSWSAALFYWAESDVNPAVQSYWDALHYIATSLSVGYANIFPMTAIGKSIGALVMIVGPALSERALEARPAGPDGASIASVVERLDAILAELRQARAAG